MKVYCKLMPGKSLGHASRNRRELEVASELGYSIFVLSHDVGEELNPAQYAYNFVYDGWARIPKDGNRIKQALQTLNNQIKVIKKLRGIHIDVLSCHDYKALTIGWIYKRLFCKSIKLIYDSHEYELGRNKRRSKMKIRLIGILERFLINRCALSIMVNDAIADRVQQNYKLKSRPLVVRSIPKKWTVDEGVCKSVRTFIEEHFKTPRSFIMMYHGAVTNGRGVESLIKVLALNKEVSLVVLGNGDANYIDMLKTMARELSVEDRVFFHKAVSIDELCNYVGAVDVGMVTIPATSKSYYYMLPNKFFENIQSETPIICSNYPATSQLVEKYDIGLLCDPTDVLAINECIERLRNDVILYNRLKTNTKVAKDELCWERESRVLYDALNNI